MYIHYQEKKHKFLLTWLSQYEQNKDYGYTTVDGEERTRLQPLCVLQKEL